MERQENKVEHYKLLYDAVFYTKNKYHKYYHTNFKDTNIDKKPELRRKTYFDLKFANKYKTLNEDLVDEDNEFEEQLKRFTTHN